MSRKSVAVLTDSSSAGFYFPLWHRYYSIQFGASNLFVITSPDAVVEFRDLELGGIWRVTNLYNDQARARTLTAAASLLLTTYDIVIRVDVDEFLIPDLRRFNSLSDYVAKLDVPYVTARGLNIFEAPGDQPLNFSRPILVEQRQFARAETTMNKTCLTSVPLVWSPGAHYCSCYPAFNDLYLVHLKRCDVEMLVRWGAWMLTQFEDTPVLRKYYGQSRDEYTKFNFIALSKPRVAGWDALIDPELDRAYFADLRYEKDTSLYRGSFHYGDKVISLPPEFSGAL